MATPLDSGFILKKGQLVISENALSASGMIAYNTPFLYGQVQQVNELCDLYKADDYVMFDASNAIQFTFSGVFYYLTTEDKVYLTEPYIAP
jgi:hypothetical protein